MKESKIIKVGRKVGIYTFGYHGWGANAKQVDEMDRFYYNYNKGKRGRGIKWIDIRFFRNGIRAKGFESNSDARSLYSFKEDFYFWLKEFGNKNARINDRDAPIAIYRFNQGLTILEKEIKKASKNNRDLILFCECLVDHKKDRFCHRENIARRLKKALDESNLRGVELLGELPRKMKCRSCGYSSCFYNHPHRYCKQCGSKNTNPY